MRLQSYDLFDTLVTRTTRRPVDVFRLLGASSVVTFRCRLLELIPFHTWRRWAERLARLHSRREDIHFRDIYCLLGWVIQRPARVMRREIALENAVITPISDTVTQLVTQHRNDTPCCVISDMYLPQRFLQKIVLRYVGDIPTYVSSEFGLTKGSGHLFQHVSGIYNVPLTEIHHSGDNPVADYTVPRQLGMSATLIPAHVGSMPAGILDVLKCPHEEDPYFEMGFRVAGPTAFVMAVFLAQQVAKDKPPNIIFGARDMPLVHYAFQHLSDYSATHYCRISRSAVYRAQFHVTGNPEPFFVGGGETGRAFFARLGAPCPPELADLSPRKHHSLFLSTLQEKDFLRESEHEFEVVRDYLHHEGFQAGTWFVDLGWRGSVQQAINEILALDLPIQGWYFGTSEPHPLQHGMYFENGHPRHRFFRVFQAISFIELVFMEAMPSLARIVRDGKNFKFVFTTDETDEQQTARTRIADGTRAFIDAMIPLHKTAVFSTNRLLHALDNLYDRYLLAPPCRWTNALKSTTHSGGFGGSGTSLLVGGDTATPFGLLRAEWQGGYIVKHANSPWVPILRCMHNPVFYTAYTTLKKNVHRYRRWRISQGADDK